MNLVRKLKISKVIPIEFTDQEKIVLNFLTDKLSHLTPYSFTKYPLVIYYMNEQGDWLFILNLEIKRITIKHSEIFKPLAYEYFIKGREICDLFMYIAKKKKFIPKEYLKTKFQYFFRTTYKDHIRVGNYDFNIHSF